MYGSLYNLGILFYIVLSIGLFGKFLLSKTKVQSKLYELNSIVYLGFGLGVFIYILILLSFTGLLNRNYVLIILTVFFFLGLKDINIEKTLKNLKYYFFYNDIGYYIYIKILILVFAIFYLGLSLSPSLEGDSLAGYLILPREYSIAQGLLPVDYAYGSFLPQNGHLISTVGFLINDQILAQLLVSWLMGLICIATIYSIGVFIFNRQVALIGSLMWYGTASVAYLSLSAKIDLAWAAFELLALYIFAQWYNKNSYENNSDLLILSGFFLGIAGGIKQVSIFTIIVLSLAIVYRILSKNHFSFLNILKPYLMFLIPVSLSIIWITRTFIYKGVLIYKIGSYPNYEGLIGFFKVIWDMSMLGNMIGSEGPMGKSIGPSILALLPFIFFFNDKNQNVKRILFFCLSMFILWYFGVQRARHFLPTIALLCIITGYVIHKLINETEKYGKLILFFICITIFINVSPILNANFISLNRHGYILGAHNLNEYLNFNLRKLNWHSNYEMTIKIRDELPINARIVALAPANPYYLNKPFYSFSGYVKNNFIKNKQEYPYHKDYYNELKNNNITHVYIREDFISNMKEDIWLYQNEFKDLYLKRIFEKNGQILYELL